MKHLAFPSETDNFEKNNQKNDCDNIHSLNMKKEICMSVEKCVKTATKRNSNEHGRLYATNPTKKVDTYCMDCNNKPSLCLECFNSTYSRCK